MNEKIFVGCTQKELLPFKVLEHSILTNTKLNVDVVPLFEFQSNIPKIKKKSARPRTPFSFQRFLIPWLCMYSGRAVYMDSDMLVFDDVAQLFKRPMGRASVLTPPKDHRRAQFAVMVVDCAACRWSMHDICDRLESGSLGYKQLMNLKGLGVEVSECLGKRWNELDSWLPDTKLLHFTRMEIQPWLAKGHPLQGMWRDALRRTVEDGFLTVDSVEYEVEAGHVRAGVLDMVKGL